MKLQTSIFCCILGFGVVGNAYAQSCKVDGDASVMAVVTHKGGLLSSQAHNHFIRAVNPTISCEGAAGAWQLSSNIDTKTLANDEFDQEQKWFPRLVALGILKDEEKFTQVSADDRAKIKENMFNDTQLDAAKFPNMSGRLEGIAAKPGKVGATETTHVGSLVLTIKGKTVTHEIPLIVTDAGGQKNLEGVGNFTFEEFGISPFSAFLGAVSNKNEFNFFVSMKITQ